jgi:hypothetical protein
MEVKINCIPYSEATKLINDWEEEDEYYSRIRMSLATKVNKLARRYPYMASKECTSSTMIVKTKVQVEGPLNLVYLDGQSDAGLPHTRGKKGIALPIFLLWNPRPSTLDHEIVHLSQKQFKDKWWAFYKKEWGFREASGEEFMGIPEKWRERRRINPDTLGNPYVIWKDRYLPLTVFVNEQSPKLMACKRGFWDLILTQWTWEPPSGWEEMFGSGFNDEHPNEIAAHWLDGSAGEDKMTRFSSIF